MAQSAERSLSGFLITGVDSGIGFATSRLALQHGEPLVATYFEDDRTPDRLRRFHTAEGGGAHFTFLDVRDVDVVSTTVAALLDRVEPPPQVLVNNAAVTVDSPVLDIDMADWSSMLNANLTAYLLVAQAFARRLIEVGLPGLILNIASVQAHWAVPGSTAYGVSKAGIVQLSRHLAVELGPRGIRALAVSPGEVATGMTGLEEASLDELRREWLPTERVSTAEEFAMTLLGLAAMRAPHLTGVEVTVDGGLTARGPVHGR